MSVRKHPRTDLYRAVPLLLQTGLIASLLLLIGAFRAHLPSQRPVIEPPPEDRIIQIQHIPVTHHAPEAPPAHLPALPTEVRSETALEPVALDLPPLESPPETSVSGLQLPPEPVPTPAEPEDEVHPFLPVEDMPEMIPNNEEGMRRLQQSINYPEIAKRAGVEGRVIVQFVVDEQGNVRDPFVVRGIGAGCDEEAVRAVRQLKFTPGRQRGKSVKVQMTLPITFRLR